MSNGMWMKGTDGEWYLLGTCSSADFKLGEASEATDAVSPVEVSGSFSYAEPDEWDEVVDY